MLTMFNPVQRFCCCAPNPATGCGKEVNKERDVAELLDSPDYPSLPSTVEVLVGAGQGSSALPFVLRGAGPAHLPAGPKDRGVPTYATSETTLQGDPRRSGTILYLKLGETIQEMHLAIHDNGFSLTPADASGTEKLPPVSRVWSPFSLIEKCQVKTMQHSSFWAVFKLTVYRVEGDDRFYYFATSGNDAYAERDEWVEEMATAIRQVTVSLFPPHAIAVRPLPGVDSTSTRIMAGYLLRCLASDNVSLFYCELHAYMGGNARLSIYKDEWCEREVICVALTDQTVVSSRKGFHCTVFGVDEHRFCARTREEKELWLRAVSNVKVKLMFDAPDVDPTTKAGLEELDVFRSAVEERIQRLPPGTKGLGQTSVDPLLPPVRRMPWPMSPRGDLWNPSDPTEEGEFILPGQRAAPDDCGASSGEAPGSTSVSRTLNEPIDHTSVAGDVPLSPADAGAGRRPAPTESSDVCRDPSRSSSAKSAAPRPIMHRSDRDDIPSCDEPEPDAGGDETKG